MGTSRQWYIDWIGEDEKHSGREKRINGHETGLEHRKV